MCVGCFSVRNHLYSSCDAENSLGNTSTEQSGTLRSQRGEIDPNTFMKTSIRYLKLLLCVYVLWGKKHLCVELALLCVRVAFFQSFLKISTLSNRMRLSKASRNQVG